jgi:hypothetical protein
VPSVIGRHVDVDDYRDLYRRTRHLRPEVRREFRRRLREAAKIGQRAARTKIRAMPATHRYTSKGAGRHFTRTKPRAGLRSTLARNIQVQVGPRDVAILQFSEGLYGRNARDLPKAIDRGGYGLAGEWLHPTYGHEPDVLQHSWPYFASSMRQTRPQMEREVAKVLTWLKVEVAKSRVRGFLGRAA